jgi:large subunit ribosomal protein L29
MNMKPKDIAELTTPELKEKLDIENENLQKMRLNHAVSTLENPIQLRFKRKLVARLHTELKKRSKV